MQGGPDDLLRALTPPPPGGRVAALTRSRSARSSPSGPSGSNPCAARYRGHRYWPGRTHGPAIRLPELRKRASHPGLVWMARHRHVEVAVCGAAVVVEAQRRDPAIAAQLGE